MVSVKLVIIPGGWFLIYSAMKLVFIGPETSESMWKLLASTLLVSKGRYSPLFSVWSGRLLSAQLARCSWCSGKAASLAKWITAAGGYMADGCVILQSWCFHLLGGMGLPEDQIRQRVGWRGDCQHQERKSSTSSLAGQNEMLVSVLLHVQCTSSGTGREEICQKNRKRWQKKPIKRWQKKRDGK